MSGHNKWSKIKHKKASSDAKKSAVFGKIVRFLTVESKKAGGDRNSPGLRAAIEKAKAANMPSDNIDRAIQKGLAADSAVMEANTYETYGPGGVAIIIETLTDSKNRTAAEVKHLLSAQGFALAAPGSASWAFTKESGVWIPNTTLDVSDEDAEKLGALVDALEELEDVQDVYTNAS